VSGTALIAAGLAFAGVMVWGLLDYQGPFRWLAEWQIGAFGAHWRSATVIVPILLLTCPLVAIGIAIQGNGRGGRIGCLSLLVLMALATLALGLGLTIRAAQRPTLDDPLQRLELAAMRDEDVVAAHAQLIGRADSAHALAIRWRGKTAIHEHVYTPITGPRDGPVRFVAMTKQIDPRGPPQAASDNPQGILLPAGLPHEARAGLLRQGVVLAPAVHLLDTTFQAPLLAWSLAVACTLAGAAALVLLLIAAWRARRTAVAD
jgi:hypothetical protein